MDSRSKRKVFTGLAVLWGAGIFLLALMPSPPSVGIHFSWFDKVEHAVALAVLTLVLGKSLESSRDVRAAWTKAFWIVVTYGAAIEVAQGLCTTSRSAEWGDLIADAVGAGAVAFLMMARGIRVGTDRQIS